MVDRIGQRLGNYRLTRLLGRGGFAEVYLGEHIYLETQAAIKILHARLTDEDIEQFRREARTIARLIHPHIVRVLEFGVEEATPYLVVDYAPNGTLRKQYTRGARLPLSLIVQYTNQVSEALQYAHDHKVIHRDVKPENMLLGRQNEVLLSDFGIALMTQSTQHNSTQNMQDMAGTVAYMAPEQIQSQAVSASDQYALAVVVYEWLSGERPFQGSFTEVAVKHTLVPPPSLRLLVPTLSPEVEAVVMRALRKEPEQRFSSVRDFAPALEQACQIVLTTTTPDDPAGYAARTLVLPSEPTDPSIAPAVTLDLDTVSTTPPKGAPSPASLDLAALQVADSSLQESDVDLAVSVPGRRPLSRRTLLAGLTGAAVVGVAGISWLALTQPFKMSSRPIGTVHSTTLYTYRNHTGPIWSVAWSPDGKYVASASSDATVQVWDAISGQHLNTYNGHSDTVYGLSWSPDSSRIASASYDQTVQVWDALTGFYPVTYKGHRSWVWTVAWSHDGKYIASGGGDKTIQIWDATSQRTVATYRQHTGYIYALAWSPDNLYLASASSDRTVQVWQARDAGLVFTYQPYGTTIWALAWSPNGRRIAVGGDDKTVRIWDALSGDHLYAYYGHKDFVYAVAWSPNSQHIASGGDDRTVQIWNAATGAPFFSYHGHTSSVRAIGWSPDSRRIASGSSDTTVQVWQTVVS